MTAPTLRLRARLIGATAVALLLAGLAACVSDRTTATQPIGAADCSTPTSVAGSTLVFIRSFAYEPVSLHVKAGASVAWVNCEPTDIPHTSTSDAAGWESGSLAPNAAYVRSFPTVGSFSYHCAIHPAMKATVIVE